MANSSSTLLADGDEPADLDTSDLIALIDATHDSLDAFLDEPAVRGRAAAHDIQPAREPPHAFTGTTQQIDTGYDHIYVNVNTDADGRPIDLFARYGKSGGFTHSFTEAIQNLVTLALQHHAPPEAVAAELRGIRSPKIGVDHGTRVQSIPDAIGLALERVIDDELPTPDADTDDQTVLTPVVDAGPSATASAADADDTSTEDEAPAGGTAETDTGRTDPEADADADSEPPAGRPAAPPAEPHVDIDPAQQSASPSLPADPESCPECGSLDIVHAEGCQTCQACGWSECG